MGGALDDLTDEQLRAKLSKRQERNRQSARRSRENKKAHEQSLREQLKAVSSEIALLNEQILRAQSVSQYSAGLASALPSPGVPAQAGVHPRPEGPPAGGGRITPTEVENFAAAGEPPRELMDRFASWRLRTVQAVDNVRTLLTMGEPGLEALTPAVTEAFDNLASLFTLREEALQQKLYLVLLNSEGFYSWEKPFLWMGFIHPSEWLRLSMVLMENRQMALQPEVKQPLDSWVEHLKAQELQISENIRSTYSLLFAAISDASSVLLSAAPEAVQAHKLKLQERLEEMAITHRQANQLWQQLIHFLRSPGVLPPPCQGQCLVALLEYLEALRSVNTLLVSIDAAA